LLHALPYSAVARLVRIVVPGLPHHFNQRGNRGETVSDGDDDYALYRDLLAQRCRVNLF